MTSGRISRFGSRHRERGDTLPPSGDTAAEALPFLLSLNISTSSRIPRFIRARSAQATVDDDGQPLRRGTFLEVVPRRD